MDVYICLSMQWLIFVVGTGWMYGGKSSIFLPKSLYNSLTSDSLTTWKVRVLFEAKAEGEVELQAVYLSGKRVIKAFMRGGQAQLQLPARELPQEVILQAPGYLPIKLIHLSVEKQELDFTNPKHIHRGSGYILRDGRVYLAAGELGQLPEEPHPVINAYDIELFILAQKQQDLRADFNGDNKVDEADLQLLKKNQNLLLSTEL